ncbi:ABC transporter ATP-binding protein [Methylobacterium persicinum]|uniref:NitT/TauT family transport system ATP-binding protein n=1 Tax=Methylobacterium persicinum TaxID=374426 RepID=A0ABU0HJ22_9HYPH|nr:ATP-binding cassette domain-containing protein [Methylobacterium persicinum]MDQ0442329.1 NitT/TauT family transport system ATP-binding protein [Methylobacterium persicinum]GJE37212.1 Nitrate import ATP-binding protein NrtD [Methylobacterium persicinum]
MSDAGADPATVLRVAVAGKTYRPKGAEPVEAVRDLRFSIREGEIACLIGPSGAGKTTTLRILLGLDMEFTGEVWGAEQASIVFQEPRLLPWRSVEHNVRLGLTRGERRRDLDALFERLGLTPWRGRFPGALSLGMQRRVALARALAGGPRVLVLDEPFVSLDDNAAAELRALVVDTVDAAGMSVLMVTHNVAEAIQIADRLLLVSKRPATLVADITLDRPRRDRDRAWADATRTALAGKHPEVIAD